MKEAAVETLSPWIYQPVTPQRVPDIIRVVMYKCVVGESRSVVRVALLYSDNGCVGMITCLLSLDMQRIILALQCKSRKRALWRSLQVKLWRQLRLRAVYRP